MGFFSIFRQNKHNDELELVLQELPEDINYQEPDETTITIDSPDIVPIVEGSVIDTLDSLNMAKYRHNVAILRKRVKETQDIGPLFTIREDDYLPEDFIWRVNSKDTLYEKRAINFTFQLREKLAEEKVIKKKKVDNLGFQIPNSRSEQLKIDEEIRKFDKEYLTVTFPAYFRSTKHFTVNTPLGFTGDYNAVKTDRNFAVIDTAVPFLESGYAYSFSGRDAYLDVTHEGFPISNDAIILVSENYFNSIKKNSELMSRLNTRKLIVYKGSLDDAINMVLSERGALPFKAGLGIAFDSEVNDITIQRLNEICDKYDIDYEKSHGGKDGHFTSWIDEEANMLTSVYEEFISFLEKKFNKKLNYLVITDIFKSREFVEEVGKDKLIEAILEYNKLMEIKSKERLGAYKKSRELITPDISDLFKRTVKNIDKLLKDNSNADIQLFQIISKFYISSNLDEQIMCANKIDELVNSMKETL